MTKKNFKNSVIALAIGLIMISCGGGSKKNDIPTTADGKIDAAAVVKQQMEEAAQQTEITAANWQSEVKKRFGVDLSIPQGWTFAAVNVYWSGETVVISFDRESDDATQPRAIASTIFNTTKALSTEGNFIVDVDSESYKVSKGKVYDSFDELEPVNKFFGEDYINSYWYYVQNGVKVVTLDCDKDKKFVVKFEVSKITI